MTLRAIPYAITALLAACSTPQPQETLPYVALGAGGSLYGGSSTTYFADETAVVVNFGGTLNAEEQTRVAMPPGTFARVSAAATAALNSVSLPDPQDMCADYGSDFITLALPGQKVREARVSCPNADMAAAMDAVRRAAL